MATAANTAVASTLYTTILLRSGSAAETNYWGTLLDSGQMTQAQEVTAFETSPEAVTSVDPIVRLYETVLHRAPDAAGFKIWENQLATTSFGTPAYATMLNTIAASFTSSAEFNGLYGATPNPTAYVTALYSNALGRAPDAAGLAYWLGQLATNNVTTEAAVAVGFATSTEFVANSTAGINAWLTTANTAAQAGSTSPYLTTIINIAPPPAGSTFTLTTAIDNFAGGAGNDTFLATFSNGGTNTLNVGDTISGGGGTDTLSIGSNIANTAVTLDDTYWTKITGIKNLVFTSTGSGAETITTGTNFNTAFSAGVNLTMTTTGGAINVAMGAYTGAETLVTTSTDGVQTLTTGSGLASITASSGNGALVILGANLSTVSATTTGAGAQTITSTGTGSLTITATDVSGAQTIVVGNSNNSITDVTVSGLMNITAGNGNNTINLGGSNAASIEHITLGTGINSITLNAAHSVADTLAFSAANAGSTTSFTTVANAHAADTITFSTTALNGTVSNQATAVASISAGIAAATLTSGYNTFHDAANTYIYEYTGAAATSELVTLIGTAHTVTAVGAVATLTA